MIRTATSRIERIAILQHHDLVTAEAIVDATSLRSGIEHHAGQRGGRTEQDDLLRTQPPEVARTERLSEARRHATGYPPQGVHPAAPSAPASAHTAACRTPFLNAPGAAPFQDATPGPPTALCTHTHAPSSGARRVQRLSKAAVRAECNASERLRIERSSRQAQPTARTHRVRRGQRAVRHPASHRDGHLQTGAECGAPANLPVPAGCNGPGNLPGTHRVKQPGRRAATQRKRTRDRVVSRARTNCCRLRRKGIRQPKKGAQSGTKWASTASNSLCGTEEVRLSVPATRSGRSDNLPPLPQPRRTGALTHRSARRPSERGPRRGPATSGF